MTFVGGLNSVVFLTQELRRIREFYRETLGLSISTYEKDGQEVPDENEGYVNFDCGGVLLGFEQSSEVETGTLVLSVRDLSATVAALESKGVRAKLGRETWAVIRDPEGREIILQEGDEETS